MSSWHCVVISETENGATNWRKLSPKEFEINNDTPYARKLDADVPCCLLFSLQARDKPILCVQFLSVTLTPFFDVKVSSAAAICFPFPFQTLNRQTGNINSSGNFNRVARRLSEVWCESAHHFNVPWLSPGGKSGTTLVSCKSLPKSKLLQA
jgi:hypothetical protein